MAQKSEVTASCKLQKVWVHVKISVFVCVCAPISFLDNSWIVAFSSLNHGSMIMSS